MTRRAWVMALAVCLAGPAASTGQDQSKCGPIGGPDSRPGRGVTFLPSVGYGGTVGPLGSATLIMGEKPPKCAKCAMAVGSRGVLLQATAGPYAGRGSVGVAAFNTVAGMAAKATLERTWQGKGTVSSGLSLRWPRTRSSGRGYQARHGCTVACRGPRRTKTAVVVGCNLRLLGARAEWRRRRTKA